MLPAARAGDEVTHPLTSGAPQLSGMGADIVEIDSKHAWRAVQDSHSCTCPPPPPPPHGLEKVFMGSMTVLINNKMACRMTDVLLGANVPNPIVGGCSTVLIGDIPFGLADPRTLEEY
jgi:uncharacterized Zn-binding protein involved in type VI secretion